MTDPDLLEEARELCARPYSGLAGRWERAAAVCARSALEEALDLFWESVAPGVNECQAMRSKMLCLPLYMADVEQARSAYETWSALSSACHVHSFDLEPNVDELLGWINSVARIRSAIAKQRADSSSGTERDQSEVVSIPGVQGASGGRHD